MKCIQSYLAAVIGIQRTPSSLVEAVDWNDRSKVKWSVPSEFEGDRLLSEIYKQLPAGQK